MKALVALSCLFGTVSSAALVRWAKTPAEVAITSPAPVPERRGVHLLEPATNLGVVGLEEQVRGTFTLVNDTDHPITLDSPLKSCSCTNAELDRRELASGERCTLTFQLRTGNRRVPRVESIAVLYTTPGVEAPQQVVARVYFVPKGVFEVEPAEVTLTRQQPRATFTVRADPKAGAKVLDVKSEHRCVKVDASKLPVVTLELDLDTPDESILNTACVVYTDHAAENMIRVPVRVRKE